MIKCEKCGVETPENTDPGYERSILLGGQSHASDCEVVIGTPEQREASRKYFTEMEEENERRREEHRRQQRDAGLKQMFPGRSSSCTQCGSQIRIADRPLHFDFHKRIDRIEGIARKGASWGNVYG